MAAGNRHIRVVGNLAGLQFVLVGRERRYRVPSDTYLPNPIWDICVRPPAEATNRLIFAENGDRGRPRTRERQQASDDVPA
jgi:hypothetical protein